MGEVFGLIGPIILVVLVIVVIRHSGTLARMESRIADLQSRLQGMEAERTAWRTPSPAATEPSPSVPPAVPAGEPSPPVVESTAIPSEPPPQEAPPEPEPAQPVAAPPSAPPKPRFDWERFVGMRLPVWLGAIALSVAGFFFVSYAIESGFFGPQMRVLSAAAASLAFLAVAEFVRRRVTTGNAATIAAALAAASIATAYATAFLATKTYELVPSGAGFIISVGVSVLALAVALAFGQVVALVGIIGGYVAPIVFGGGDANAPFLAIYVTLLTAVSFALIRLKGWWRLSIVGLIGPGLYFLVWASAFPLRQEALWGSIIVIALPIIVLVASWPGWREDGPVIGIRGITAARTPERGALVAATILSAAGFVVLLAVSDHAVTYWQGLIVFAAAAVALGFVSPPHRALQLPIALAAGVALLLWVDPDRTAGFFVIALLALVFGFGALDQFRRLREPGLWAGVLAVLAVFLFGVALFQVEGWGDALANRHVWALAALAIAAGFVAMLQLLARHVEPELARSQVYAAWGGAVTTLASLAVTLELDPLYFPAAAALAILGLAAVHMRAPVRGLRIVAGVYLVLYVVLLLGAFSYGNASFTPFYFGYVFARNLADHALAILVIPGVSLLASATLFQISRPTESRGLVTALDVVALAAVVAGLFYMLLWPYAYSRWSDTLMLAARIVGPELIVAAVAVYLGRRFARGAAYAGGIILTGLMMLGMLAALLVPLLQFWPPYEVPGLVVINVTLVAYGVPALLLYFIGWYLRHDPSNGIRIYGIVVSVFAVVVTYAMLMVDIRHAYNFGAPTLAGDVSQSEFYAYSIATLAFGLALLIGGVAFKHRGARALSFFFVLAATIKVFIFDAAELEGLWRVLSFLLMGLAFLAISWSYARFVFGIGVGRPKPPSEPSAPVDTPASGG
jgi:uncharacterized membrane protein